MATVRISKSLAAFAMTGAAPVPVPPPIPALMKTILVLHSKTSTTSLMFSSAAIRPFKGQAPAPRPSVTETPN